MAKLVRENLVEAQQKQNHWCDWTARETEFQAGEQVVVLLSTTASTLIAVLITGDLHFRYARYPQMKEDLYVNMLWWWHTPVIASYFVLDEEDLP